MVCSRGESLTNPTKKVFSIMSSTQWKVSLNNNGRTMTEHVQATNQGEARKKAERLNPGYKGGSASRA